MSTTHARESHVILYVLVSVVLLLFTGVALLSFLGAKQDERATEKANQLSSELAAAGLRAPATDQIARVLGDDGGSVCADPGNALRRSVLYGMLTNGAAGPGQRPVIADNNALKGQLLIMKVYCPQYVDDLQQVADDLRTADLVTG